MSSSCIVNSTKFNSVFVQTQLS